MPKLMLYTLLYVSSAPNVNLRAARPERVYCLLAARLAEQASRRGYSLTVLTNDASAVREGLALRSSGNSSLIIKELTFDRDVPLDIKFYAAHFKLDAYRHIACEPVDYAVMIDLDIAWMGDGTALARLAEAGDPTLYKITDQVLPAYGQERILRDLQEFDPKINEVNWWGGEFLAAKPSFFATLVDRLEEIWPHYIACREKLHHHGDEMLVSAVVPGIRREEIPVRNSSLNHLISRYWSGRVLHRQASLVVACQHELLHLPQDKVFLTKVPSIFLCTRALFVPAYALYVAARRVARGTSKVLSFSR